MTEGGELPRAITLTEMNSKGTLTWTDERRRNSTILFDRLTPKGHNWLRERYSKGTARLATLTEVNSRDIKHHRFDGLWLQNMFTWINFSSTTDD